MTYNDTIIDIKASLLKVVPEALEVIRRHSEKLSDQSKFDMPGVPPPLCNIKEAESIIPQKSGVYFFWNSEIVQYVGKSKNIAKRIRRSHHKYDRNFSISFLLFPEDDIIYAECFYIWRLRPPLNFTSSL